MTILIAEFETPEKTAEFIQFMEGKGEITMLSDVSLRTVLSEEMIDPVIIFLDESSGVECFHLQYQSIQPPPEEQVPPMEFVAFPRADGLPDDVFPLGSQDDIAAAKAAMAERNVQAAIIFTGQPNNPENPATDSGKRLTL